MSKVLVVEDDNNLREIYETSLKAEGYETSSASDGLEAIEIAGRNKPDLIISDVMMPRLSGFEMLEKMRQDDNLKDVPVIMMTALSMAEDKETAKRLGVVHYLVKSQVTLEDFVNVAKKFVNPSAGSDSASVSQPAGTQAPEPSKADEPEPSPAQAAAAPVDPPAAEPASAPAAADPEPEPSPEPEAAPPAPLETPPSQLPPAPSQSQSTDEETGVVEAQIQDFVDNQPAGPADIKTAPAEPAVSAEANPIASSPAETAQETPNSGKKVIEPIIDPNKKDISQLAAAEEIQRTANEPVKNPSAGSAVDPNSIAL